METHNNKTVTLVSNFKNKIDFLKPSHLHTLVNIWNKNEVISMTN